MELYKRESCLSNDIKVNSNLKYDMMMSGIGAFLGVVLGHWFQEMQQTVAEVGSVTKGMFQESDPMKTLSGGMFGWAMMFL